jgi:hypothetical protein
LYVWYGRSRDEKNVILQCTVTLFHFGGYLVQSPRRFKKGAVTSKCEGGRGPRAQKTKIQYQLKGTELELPPYPNVLEDLSKSYPTNFSFIVSCGSFLLDGLFVAGVM